MTREISRRLAALERDGGGDRIRYDITDQMPSDEEWEATCAVAPEAEPEALSPILSEADWIARFCF